MVERLRAIAVRSFVAAFGRRLGAVLVAVLLGAVASQCRAEGTVTGTTSSQYCLNNGGQAVQSVCGSSVPGIAPSVYGWKQAAGAYSSWTSTSYVGNVTCGSDPVSSGCSFTYGVTAPGYSGTRTDFYGVVVQTSVTCPANSTRVGTTSDCACASGYAPGSGVLTGLCVPPTNCPAAGTSYSSGWYDVGTDITVAQVAGCVAGCAYAYDGSVASKTTIVNGVKHYWALGQYTSTGQKCGEGASDPTTAPPPPSAASAPTAPSCPTGEVLGTVQRPGSESPEYWCAPVASASASSPSTGTPDKPKDVTTCSESSTTAGDGTITKSKTCTTTYADGTKGTSTTVTTTAPNGSTSSTTTNTGAGAAGGGAGTAGTVVPIMSPGTGDGSGSGGSGGGGPCADNSSAAGCGGAAGQYGNQREPGTKTFGGVLGGLRDQLATTQLGSAVTGFFTVTGAGSCPSWTWHIPVIESDHVVDVFCTPWGANTLAAIQVVFLVVCSWFAFRVAME